MNWNILARGTRASLPVAILGAALVASTILFSGCAFTTGHVNLAYEPTTQASEVATADSPRVIVEVADKRPTQAVGQKINGFGMKTADIVSDSDVAATLKTAFETELHSRGFTDGAGKRPRFSAALKLRESVHARLLFRRRNRDDWDGRDGEAARRFGHLQQVYNR